jgi:hypothetical protein
MGDFSNYRAVTFTPKGTWLESDDAEVLKS